MCLPATIDEDDNETLKRAIAMSLHEDPPTIKVEDSEEELLAKAMAMSLEEHPGNKEENISEEQGSWSCPCSKSECWIVHIAKPSFYIA